MDVDAATGRLVKILGQMGQYSQDALRTGIAGEEPGTRAAVDRLRHLQAKLGTVDQAARKVVGTLPKKQQQALQEALSHIRAAEEFVRTWSKRYQGMAKVEELSKSSEGRHGVLDYTLSLDWNFEGDVFILFDESDLSFAPELLERGQKRILFVGPEKPVSDAFLPIHHAHSAADLRSYFMQLATPVPMRLGFIAPREAQDREVLWKDIKHAFTLAHSNFHTHKALGSAWMTQGLRNLDAIARSANLATLKPSLSGLPIVIISPGPSLDKNIHLLKALKGRAILMAAAQCARALQAAEVVPDFLVVADPGNLVYFLDGVDTGAIDALIIGVSSHPDFYKKQFKNIVTFNANAGVDTWISNIFGDTSAISSAGSVSIDCLFFAKYFQCSHILMVGLDLALSEGKAYSSQSANSESTVNIDTATNTLSFSNVPETMERIFLAQGASSEDTIEPVLTLPGYFGGTVQTRPNYHLFHGEFVVIAKNEVSAANPTPLVNCTEGGAYIEGFEHIRLEEAIKKYIPDHALDLSAKIDAACKSTDSAARLAQCSAAKESIEKKIKNLIALVYECRLFTKKKRLTTKQLEQLNRAEKKLIQSLANTPYISLPNVSQIRKSIDMANDTSTINEANKVAEFLYDTIEMTAQEILKIIHEIKYNSETAKVG